MTSVNLEELFADYQKNSEITVLDPATYDLEVISAKVANKEGGKGPRINPTFRVHSGPLAGKRVLAGGYSLTEASAGIFFQQMKSYGFGEDFWKSFSGNTEAALDAAAAAMVGKVIRANVAIRPYNGEPRNDIPINGITLIGQADPVAGGVTAAAPVATATPLPQPQAAAAVPAAPPAAVQIAEPAPEAPLPLPQETAPAASALPYPDLPADHPANAMPQPAAPAAAVAPAASGAPF
jgi:hypothetical protein